MKSLFGTLLDIKYISQALFTECLFNKDFPEVVQGSCYHAAFYIMEHDHLCNRSPWYSLLAAYSETKSYCPHGSCLHAVVVQSLSNIYHESCLPSTAKDQLHRCNLFRTMPFSSCFNEINFEHYHISYLTTASNNLIMPRLCQEHIVMDHSKRAPPHSNKINSKK